MSMFLFEVVGTVDGQPDPMAFPEGLSVSPKYSGSAMAVYWEFPDEEEARAHATFEEDDDWNNPIRDKYKQLGGGLDIFYIRQLAPEDEREVSEAKSRVLYHKYKDTLTPEIFKGLRDFRGLKNRLLSQPQEKKEFFTERSTRLFTTKQ